MPYLPGHYRDAYIVDYNGKYVGVVRRERNIWRIFQLAPSTRDLSNEGFATRDDAGQRLIELATQE